MRNGKGLRSRPDKRESRPTGIERLPERRFSGDGRFDSIRAARVQFIARHLGLNSNRAEIVADLAFESSHG